MIPTEDQEQATLVQYCKLKNYPHFRVPNETYTKSWKQKAKNKALGVVKGVPDLFVIVNDKLIAIEMKRASHSLSRATKEQLEWIERLNKANIPAKVCYGSNEAIDFINQNK